MKETVAEKVSGIQWIYLALAVVCAGLLVYFAGFYSANSYIKFILSAILVVFVVVCIASFICAIRTPKTIATYDDKGTLTFPEFSCRPRDIDGVEYKFAKGSKMQGNTPDHGTLYVTYRGKRYTYYFVRELNRVSARLAELITADKTLQQMEEEVKEDG